VQKSLGVRLVFEDARILASGLDERKHLLAAPNGSSF